MIVISYSKEDKNTAKKLLSKLEFKGYKCWMEPRDIKGNNKKESISLAIKETELMILLFSKYSNNSDDVIEQYDLAFEEEVPIIPFVVSDLKMTVSAQHFLNTHDWINAFDSNFNEATEDLIDLMESEEADNSSYEKKEPRSQKNTKTPLANNEKQKYIIGGIAAVFVVILLVIFFWQPSNNSDSGLIGSWSLTNYEDNIQRTPEDLTDFQGQITYLKQNFSLTLKDNNSFERRGFTPQAEFGTWDVLSIKGDDYLKLTPMNKKDGDALLMREFTEDKLVLSIASNIDSMQVITTLTLQKN